MVRVDLKRTSGLGGNQALGLLGNTGDSGAGKAEKHLLAGFQPVGSDDFGRLE